MKSLSVCMIVKNEEKNIEKILSEVKQFADEIIIVDTGSTDDTKVIAQKYTDKIYDFVWCDDFSKARNYSFSKASGNYLMWLDADDFVLPEDIEKLKKLKRKKLGADVYMLKYVASFDENFKPQFSYYRERIVRRDKNFVWHDPVHEVIIPRGKIEYLDISIYHSKKVKTSSDRNLKIYQNLLREKVEFSPRQRFYYARELYFNNKIDEAIKEFSKFLLDERGWKENRIEACLDMAKCFIAKGEYDNALTALFGSFNMGTPRGEILYEIGNVFFYQGNYEDAIYWYKSARNLKPEMKNGGFIIKDCYDFLPALQLCVCYYHFGDMDAAKHFHEITKKIYPNDASVLHNEKFFTELEIQKRKR